MKKLAVAALALVVLIGAGTLLEPQISEMLADRSANNVVHTCYIVENPPLYFGLDSYDSEKNTFKFQGALMGMIPVAGEMPRDAVLEGIKSGELQKQECPPGVFDQE